MTNKLLLLHVVFLILASYIVGCSSTQSKTESTTQKQESLRVDTSPQDKKSKQQVGEDTKTVEKKSPDVEVISNDADTEVIAEPIKSETQAPKEKIVNKLSESPEEDADQADTATKVESVKNEKKEQKELVSTGPNHFIITADVKDQSHPFYGKGHKMGFSVNGVPGKEIVMERGKSYKIDVSTDPMHDVYVSTKEIGWGSTPWVDGVEGMYTYKGIITVKPDNNAPDYLYYSCRNHPYMGGKIHVINPGETADLSATKKRSANAGADKSKSKITTSAVNQKFMFAEMIVNSKNTQRVLDSGNQDAINKHEQGKKNLQKARAELAAGKNDSAFMLAENAIVMLKEASQLVPNKGAIEELKKRHDELKESLHNFEESHARNHEMMVKKQGKESAVSYDKNEVENLKKQAALSVEKNDFNAANKSLENAQHIVTSAIQKMLNAQTIVYDLNFETPEEEYDYELRRFGGYEELIPVAVEVKKPNQGTIGLMNTYVKKGQGMRDKAIAKSKTGDFPTAILMLQDATKEIRRALRMVGVMQ